MKDVFLSVIIPCYDEMANLRKGVLDRVEHFLSKKNLPYEVIIVDDGSTDGSVGLIERFISENPHFSLIKNPHFGKAGAVTTGMLAAKGKFRLFTDMDQATPIEEVDKLLPFLQSGEYDVVIGSRSNMRQGAPFIRLFVSRSSMTLRKVLIGLREIDDTQCGFKMFTDSAAENLFSKLKKIKNGFQKINGPAVTYGSDIELLYLAHVSGYKIKEVPVEWLYVESRRVSPVKDSVQGVRDLLKIKTNAVSGKYS
jgi:glycosyltransferase involved in cell wall biosynthesis